MNLCSHPSRPRARNRGSMLITSMLLSTAIGVGLVGYLQLSKTSLKLANRTFLDVEAGNLAEAGLEQALCSFTQLNSGVSSALSWTGWTLSGITATRTLTFNTANTALGTVKIYVNSYDISLTTPYIISQAKITPLDGSPPITEVRRMDLQAKKSPGAAIVGLNGVTFNGGSTVDSFVSSPGGTSGPWSTYPGSGARANACVIVPAGTIKLSDESQIKGDLKLGSAVTAPDGDEVSGTITKNYTGSWSLPALPAWSSLASSRVYYGSLPSTLPVAGHAAASDGVYYYVLLAGDISTTTISDGKKVVILGVGTSLQPGLVVGSGSYCLIYMDGVINAAGTGAITNNGWAGALQIFSWTTSTCNLGNKAQTMACIMAPFAPIVFTGNGNTGSFTGSVIGKTVTVNGHMDFHYDETLGNLGSIGSIGSTGTAGTTANSALVGITRTRWTDVKSTSDLANLGTLTGGFLP